MKKHNLFLTILFALLSNLIFAQSSEAIRKYIATYKNIAIAEEIRTGVPAAITLAQGIHETSAGTSDLVLSSNNHFGIKCKSDWAGPAVYHDDDLRGECFRKYNDPKDSYKDHSDFLKTRPNYAFLFQLDPTDYKAWAYGLKKAGYATNPMYAQVLIKLIEDYDLQEYTMIALNGKVPNDNNSDYANNTNTLNPGNLNEVTTNEDKLVTNTVKPNYPTGIFQINETNVVFVPKGTSYLKVAEENKIDLSRLFDFNDMKPADIAADGQLIFLQRKRTIGAHEFHIVANNETLYDIAQSEGIRIESLLGYNFLGYSMQPQIGEKLYLHAKAPSMPKLVSAEPKMYSSAKNPVTFMQPTNKTGRQDDYIMHTVEPKETMYAIAKKYSVAIDDLMRWNDMQTMDLKPGQQLRINKKNGNVN